MMDDYNFYKVPHGSNSYRDANSMQWGAWKSAAVIPGSKVDNGLSIQAVPNPAGNWVRSARFIQAHFCNPLK
jgi:hypothetical protein